MHNTNFSPEKKYRLHAAVIGGLTALCAIVCIFLIVHNSGHTEASPLIAEIYQDGRLIKSLDLNSCGDMIFTISGNNGCYNTIEVQDGRIRITSASCPDKICVNQGFIDSPLLPITCLPNKVVITLHEAEDSGSFGDIDMTAY